MKGKTMLSTIGNYYEHLVMECLREALEQRQEAIDDDYLDDLACVALNFLPTRYVRHSIDLASRLSDEERRAMREEVADAVSFAFTTIQGRRKDRDAD
jgi:hypothetical protein